MKPTGPFVNTARNIHTGNSHPSPRRPSPVYIRQNVHNAIRMKKHINMSIRSTIPEPMNIADVNSIRDAVHRPPSSVTGRTHRFITHAHPSAGSTDSSDNSPMLHSPASHRHPISSQKYNGGLSAYTSPWL